MAQTVKDLMDLGLSETEAQRVVKRKEKEAAKSATTIALAEKRLPKAQADLDHATARQAHWAAVVEKAGSKVAKYAAIIAGEDVALPTEEETASEDEDVTEVDVEAPAAKKATSRKK